MSEKSMRSTRLGGVLQNDIAVREGGIFDLQSWRFYCFFCSKILVFVAFSSPVVRLNFKLPMMFEINSNGAGRARMPSCLSLLIRFRGQNRRGINKLTTLALAVETTPQRGDDIGLSSPPPDLRG
jgi:hypothetical protein